MYRKLVREGSKPLFEGVKVVLTDVIALISKNQVPIQNFIRAFSEKILVGIQQLPGFLDTVFKHMERIKTAAEIFAGIWVTTTVTTGITNIIKLVGDLTKAVIALNTASAGGILSKLGGGVAAAGGAVLSAAGLAAGAITLMPGTAGGGSDDFYARNRKLIADIQNTATAAIKTAAGITAGTTWTGGMADAVQDFLPGLRSAYQQSLLGTAGFRPEQVIAVAQSFGYAADEVTRLAESASATNAAAKVGATGAGKGPSVNIQNARFDIKQSFAEGYDPDRIAVAFTDTLAKLGQYRGQSSFSLAGAVP
jgi:hypothetical protein